ncbi:MAG TPA: sugar phosphate isomerase/epimerase family protein [Planctomycetota bacterium]|nr:sugar phosphate isomerase/epimerase family protein [Planctomycetota bacterium]
MSIRVSRREFLATCAAGAGLAALGRTHAAEFKTKLQKAVILGEKSMNDETLKRLKEAGIEGIEAHTVPVDEAKKARDLAEKYGLKIHSVMRGGSEAGLRAAQAYGADAVLAPVGGCGAKPMPEPWEFDIQFDEKTGHITRLVAGDNEKFKAYIEAHNRSTDGVLASIKKLLPVAEEVQVAIALENVWNNWCVRPELYNWVVASFNSPWVKAYFDVGNHVKYAGILRGDKVELAYMPEVWIRTFGPRLGKIHVKDYTISPDGRTGNWAGIGQGSVNWPEVRKALDDVGYNGWLTDETGLGWPELAKRLDRIIAGEAPVPSGK